MLVALGTLLLASTAFAGLRPPPRCANITVKAFGNCPKKGYECDEGLAIKYKTRSNGAKVEVQCVDNDAELAVGKRIVDEVKCRGDTWRALGEDCDISTTSVVCAKSCGFDVCPGAPDDAPNQYDPLEIHHPTRNSKCAYAECEQDFVAFNDKGTFFTFPSSTSVTCSGNGKWKVDKDQYDYVMCKRPINTCQHNCIDRPWTIANLTSDVAIQDGCASTCDGDKVLSRPSKKNDFAIALSSATCTRRGFLVDNDRLTERIGCITCDILDGDVINTGIPENQPNHPATSEGCIATCPKHFRLRYRMGKKSDFAPGRIIYRKFTPTGNAWITRDGVTITEPNRIDCVMEESCFDDDV